MMETKTEYWPNGNIRLQIDYHQGQLHGKNIGWNNNGQKRWETDYHQGQPHGKCIAWYENGQKRWEEYYLYGEKVSPKEYRKHELIIQLSDIKE